MVGAAQSSPPVPAAVPEHPSMEAAPMVTIFRCCGPSRIMVSCAGILRRFFPLSEKAGDKSPRRSGLRLVGSSLTASPCGQLCAQFVSPSQMWQRLHQRRNLCATGPAVHVLCAPSVVDRLPSRSPSPKPYGRLRRSFSWPRPRTHSRSR